MLNTIEGKNANRIMNFTHHERLAVLEAIGRIEY
jgi:hypothetical protein